MSNRDQGVGPRKSNKTGPTIHDIRVDNSPLPPDRATARPCQCGVALFAVMTDGKEFEYILLGHGCTDAIRRAELRGWRRANRCQECGAIYEQELVTHLEDRLVAEPYDSRDALLKRVEKLQEALENIRHFAGGLAQEGDSDPMSAVAELARAALSNHSPAGEGATNG